ncbi:MAG: DUF669 domain-containing protein [Phycisphaerales bacterium]|nr:DUF669 domain-containing protein [Phycisphaerales bacterium]
MENSNRKRRLGDILAGDTDEIRKQWDHTNAAEDFGALPGGAYICHVAVVELFNAKTKGTPGVKIAFRIVEGDYANRRVFHDLWLTAAALPQTKRDLTKLGIQQLEQLETMSIPPGRIRCRVYVALRTGDDGLPFNSVKRFDVLGIDEPPVELFAPADGDGPDGPDGTHGDGVQAADGDGDASFDPAALDTETANETADGNSDGKRGKLFPDGASTTAWAER